MAARTPLKAFALVVFRFDARFVAFSRRPPFYYEDSRYLRLRSPGQSPDAKWREVAPGLLAILSVLLLPDSNS